MMFSNASPQHIIANMLDDLLRLPAFQKYTREQIDARIPQVIDDLVREVMISSSHGQEER